MTTGPATFVDRFYTVLLVLSLIVFAGAIVWLKVGMLGLFHAVDLAEGQVGPGPYRELFGYSVFFSGAAIALVSLISLAIWRQKRWFIPFLLSGASSWIVVWLP